VLERYYHIKPFCKTQKPVIWRHPACWLGHFVAFAPQLPTSINRTFGAMAPDGESKYPPTGFWQHKNQLAATYFRRMSPKPTL